MSQSSPAPTDLSPFRSAVKFNFDTKSDSGHLLQFMKEYKDLADRVDRLINEPTLNGHPVVKYVMQMVDPTETDWNELLRVGKALERLAGLLQDYYVLAEKVNALNFIRENPQFVAWAFGNYTDDIEKLITAATTDEGPSS